MDQFLLQQAIKLNNQRKRRMWWKRFVRVVAMVVVFCTTYALILPAITLHTETVCGMEEHRHTELCYGPNLSCLSELSPANTVHTHDTLCYGTDGEIRCTLQERVVHEHEESCYNRLEEKTCLLEETDGHTHEDACYEVSEVPICGLEELPAHTHEDTCYGSEVLTCQLAITAGHTHEETCYELQQILTCTQQVCEPHIHSDGCFEVETVFICGREESAPHSHTGACYQTVENQICAAEESEGHSHTDACYQKEERLVCTKTETDGHTHNESCKEQKKNWICTLAETEGHAHLETCYTEKKVAVCGQEEHDAHEHGSSCYQRPLTCQLQETEGHTHSEICNIKSICTLAEISAHSHDKTCVAVKEELLCKIPEVILHAHDRTCRNESGELICDMQEFALHKHTETCVKQEIICGLEEHAHEEACYPVEETAPTETGFICGYGRHTHREDCYGEDGILICSVPEHTHSAACVVENYDPQADDESESDWYATVASVPLTGNWPTDVLTIAESQLGYRESVRNVVLQEDGTLKGYSRYGDWYGIPHGDWCAMYVAFCMHYAGVKHYPVDAACQKWIQKLEERGFYRNAESYEPKPGDIIFFDGNKDGISDHVGLVTSKESSDENAAGKIHTIEGNSGDRVQQCSYDADDPVIIGYGVMASGEHITMSVRSDDYTVTVNFGASAQIPADAQLDVREIHQGTAEYQNYYEQSLQALHSSEDPESVQGISFARFFDISFVVGERKIEPYAPVSIAITYDEAVEIAQNDTGLAIHFADEGIEILDAITNAEASDVEQTADTFVFIQDSFSVTGTVVTGYSVPRAANDFDLSNAQRLTDVISSIKVMNGLGVETKVFANGDAFTIVMEGTIQSYQFSGSNPKTFYFNLSDTMKLASYACSSGVSSAFIDGSSNTFLMAVDPVVGSNGFQPVPFRVELHGQAINQTGGVSYVTIRWDQYQVYSSKQVFTYSGTDGIVVTAQIMGGSFSPSRYQLMLEQVDETNYLGNIRNFVANQYSRRDLVDAAVYKVWLQNISNPNEKQQLASPYVLVMEYSDGQVAVPSGGQGIVINMNNGSPNKPTGYAVETYGEYVSKASISDPYSALSQFAVASLTGITEGTTGSGYSLQFNDQTDAFIRDPAYAGYYNENSPIGTAGSFHIVAFDTANLDTHTNGNVLAKNLNANSNFGTNNYDHELTYIQNYLVVNSNSASKAEHVLVIGSENELGLYDNNNKYTVNGNPIDRPKNIVQDRNTASAPFINLNRVRAEIRQIAANLVGYSDMNLDVIIMDQKNVISLTDPDAVGILNVKPTDTRIFGKDYLQMSGFRSGHEGSIVINVDCTGVSQIDMPKALVVVDGQEQGTNEVVEFSNGKVLWNFINAEGVTINTHLMTGMVIAPGATVNVMQNLNGTVVADVVNIKAESHRTDFTGKIVPQTQTETHSVTIQKIREGYVGTTLANAHFDLYIWDGNGWSKVNTQSLVTNSNGLFLMERLKLNTAYKLVETVAPAGYVLMEEPCYFWVRENSGTTSPTLKPEGFTGMDVASGGILNITNEMDEQVQTTSIELQKIWDTEEIINTDRVTVSVYQLIWHEDAQIEKHLYKTVVLAKTLNWSTELSNLPLNGMIDDGRQVHYTYSVEEVRVPGFVAEYSIDNRLGVSAGTVTITNRSEADEEPGYVLPETGGSGTQYHILCGALLTVLALAYLHLLPYRRRRGDSY